MSKAKNYLTLSDAIIKNDLEEVKKLLSKGGDANEGIWWASSKGHLEIVKYCVENGADVNPKELAAIFNASSNGHLDIVKYLVENGADVTSNDNLAIECASGEGHLEVVKYLHQNGGDLNDKVIEVSSNKIKEQLIAYKASMEEKALIQSDLKEVKQEQQKPKNTMRI